MTFACTCSIRGTNLAVLAEDGGFWLCRASSDVWLDADTFSACWLEKEGESDLYKTDVLSITDTFIIEQPHTCIEKTNRYCVYRVPKSRPFASGPWDFIRKKYER